ncbi:AAA family ATPase [Croceibacterium soli]|nr:AAA family ATPase [Croceibacterium soli]
MLAAEQLVLLVTQPLRGAALYTDANKIYAIQGNGGLSVANGQTRHVSVRIPWHDAKWDGTVCRNPKGNSACLAIGLIAEQRDDEFEANVAGTAFADLAPSQLPPCVRERAGFLSGTPQQLRVTMPYSQWSDHHAHILPTDVALPGYGGVLVPYRWMLREPAQQRAEALSLDLDPDREPQPPMPDFMVNTAWVQDVENQRSMLQGFAAPLETGTSLVFFYARRTPLAEGLGNPIVAVATLEHVGTVDEYPYKGGGANGRVRSMIWERPFQHSLRPTDTGFAGGVVLPYHEILALAESDKTIDTGDFLAFAPEEAREQFLYGSEHVEHGAAIAALQSVRNAVERAAEKVPGDWAASLEWIDARLSELWRLRGPAPGLGSALSCLQYGLKGTLFAHALAPQLEDAADPWPVVTQIFADKRPAPFGGPQLTGHQKKLFLHLQAKKPEKYALMQMLSRFELSKDQALAIWDEGTPLDFVKNPYELYQRTRFTKEPIALGTIDRGLFGGAIEDRWPLPDTCQVNPHEPDDVRRLLAVAIKVMDDAALEGHTLLPADQLEERAMALPLSPAAPLGAEAIEILQNDFAPEVLVTGCEGSQFAQLERYVEAGEVIRRAVTARLGATATPSIDWRPKLDNELDLDCTAEQVSAMKVDPLEQAAREEKALALEQLAQHRIAVLIGPAGSGKTTLLKILLNQPDLVGGDIVLLAPTGKARVRLGDQTKMPERAQTLAQFLLREQKWDPDTGAYMFPRTGPTAQISTCIVDEASMLTEDQLAALVSSLPTAARLILVGDPQQLPPIGAGRPFVDLIAHLATQDGPSGIGHLSISRRQKREGDGSDSLEDIQLAKLFSGDRAGAGEDEIAGLSLGGATSKRLQFLEWDTPEALRARLAEALSTEFKCSPDELEKMVDLSLGSTSDDPRYFNPGAGRRAERWQILTPHRDLPSGSAELNRHIKRLTRNERLQFARRDAKANEWKVVPPRGPDQITYGDKVICLQNHPRNRWNVTEKGKSAGYLANGEVGVVIGAAGHGAIKYTRVEFATQPGHTFSFGAKAFADHTSPMLELGYAVTVHKAQGSEFGTTFLVLPANSRLLTRELLYTALTRQKDRLWILHQGPFGSFFRYRSEFHSETARRVTNLFEAPLRVEVTPPVGEPPSARRTFLEDKLIHRTRRGDLVASKSEIVIADILYELEQKGSIRFSYEKPRMLAGVERWPDFTIEHGSEVWYWEHCGMLKNSDYAARWKRKKAAYVQEGISVWSQGNPSGRLIVTEDDNASGLDSHSLHELAASLWG